MSSEITYSAILVPTDGSEYSYRAGEHAVYLAGRLSASLIILNVVNVDMAFHAGIHYAESVASLERSGRDAVARIKTLCDRAGVPARELLVRGVPHVSILKVAEDEHVDLIVMGSVGMSAIERALIGSVSEHVARHAGRPVLLVRDI